jgi:hypothetical protein
MNSRIIGTILKKNTKTRAWWLKLSVALILSNIFFFLLFAAEDKPYQAEIELAPGWVEIQLRADLMTPFQKGKKILLIHRSGRQSIEGMLQAGMDPEGRLTILVKEAEAALLFVHQSWEILPFIANHRFPALKGERHEIRY